MTPYQKHRAAWIGCMRCDLCKRRTRVVLARGSIPARVLFVGEAPGASEDVLGKPFIGPAGKLLDRIIAESIGEKYRYAITNLVACIPKSLGNEKGEPPEESIEACRPRLQEFVRLVRPELIIAVGTLSQKWLPKLVSYVSSGAKLLVSIMHPAAILRMDVSQKGLAIQRCIVAVSDALKTID